MKTACPPVDAVMLFEHDDVRVAVDGSSSTAHTFVRVMFEVPEGKTVRFPDRVITVSTRAGESATAAPERYFRAARRGFSLDSPMVGERETSVLRRTTPYGRSDPRSTP